MPTQRFLNLKESKKNAILEAQQSLPATGQFTSAIASLKEILGLVNEVWDSEGGHKEQAKLAECINELEGYSDIESQLGTVKTTTLYISQGNYKEYLGRSKEVK